MRFPDLVAEVSQLRYRLETYETDISYLLNRVREMQEELNAVRPNPDPGVGQRPAPTLLDALREMEVPE